MFDRLPQEAPHNVFEQSHSLSLDQANNHVAQYSAYSVEALVGSTYVAQPSIVEKYLLYDEYSDRLAQFATCFHDPQA